MPKKISFTQIYIATIAGIILMIDGPLKNQPILLILIPAVVCSFYIRKMHLYKTDCLLCVLYAYTIFITIVNWKGIYNPTYAVNRLIQYALIFISLKIINEKINEQNVLYFFRNLGIIGGLLAIPEGITGKHFIANILGKYLALGSSRVLIFFNHPIVCGNILLISFCLLICMPLRNAMHQFIALLIMLIAIALTMSRSAWIAVLVVFIIYTSKKKKTHRLKKSYFVGASFVLALLAISSVTFCSNIFYDIINFFYLRIHNSLDAGEGHIVRIEIIINSFNYWANHIVSLLFGRGLNSGLLFLNAHPVSKFNGAFVWTAAIDNQYITLLHEVGLVGTTLIIIIIGRCFIRTIRAKERDAYLGVGLSLVASSVILFFFEGFDYPLLVTIYIQLLLIFEKWALDRDSE